MSFTGTQETEIRNLLQNRWPLEVRGTSDTAWSEWRRSLLRFSHADVMLAVFGLSETSERFPSLARLIAACYEQREQRERDTRSALAQPARRQTTLDQRLGVFDQAAADMRIELHAELEDADRKAKHSFGAGVLTEAQLQSARERIDAVGPHEAKARELIAAGQDPAEAAKAHVEAFTESATRHQRPRRDDAVAVAAVAVPEMGVATTPDFSRHSTRLDQQENQIAVPTTTLIDEEAYL